MNNSWKQELERMQEAAQRADHDGVEAHAQVVLQQLDVCDHSDSIAVEEVLATLALSRSISGNSEEAKETYSQLLRLQEARYGTGSLQAALTLKAHAEILEENGEFEKAEPMFLRSADLLTKSINHLMYVLGNVWDSVSVCNRESGRLDEALEHATAAVEYIERATGSQDDLALIDPLRNQALLLRAMDKDLDLAERIEARVGQIIAKFEERRQGRR